LSPAQPNFAFLTKVHVRYFLKLAYRGTHFHGWQRQPNAPTVQEHLENAFATVLQETVALTAAGRTDTGVHAREMYAHLDLAPVADPEHLLRDLNRMIGPEIALHSLQRVRPEAHARFDATARQYRYYLSRRKDPFRHDTAHYYYGNLDVEAMNAAASILLQYDDFGAFCKSHAQSHTNICMVSQAHWQLDSHLLIFTITANRFLRNMVRAIVGTLLEVGRGRRSLLDFERVIAQKDRTLAGESAPAQGLFLERVMYPKELFDV